MRIVSRVSAGLGDYLVRMGLRRINSAQALSLPFWSGRRLPRRLKRWLKYRVLDPTDDAAVRTINAEAHLGTICRDRFGLFALSPAVTLWLWRNVWLRRPNGIIELGSGISTSIFATYAAAIRAEGGVPPIIWSLEHDPEWMQHTQEHLDHFGLTDYVRVLHAPIRSQPLLGTEVPAYDLERASAGLTPPPQGFDFCLIDGPPAREFGRWGSLPILEDLLADGAFVSLDDSIRPHELEVWRRWQRWSRGRLRSSRLNLIGRGLLSGAWESSA